MHGLAQPRMNNLGDTDIHQAFARALPSAQWSSSPLLVTLVDASDWESCLPGALALLDPVETTRMRRKRNQGDREVLTLAYALHRLLLGGVLGIDASAVPLWRDANGCPRVGDNLVHTSLSHAGRWIALAVSTTGPVGVDIESRERIGALPEIAGSICHPREAADLVGITGGSYGEALLALWVRKEALLKAAGVGLAREMSSFLAPEGELPLALEGAETTCVQMLDAGAACLAAVAGPPGVRVALAWLDAHRQ